MLILTRKIGESIVIEGGIVIKLLALEGHTARLGIQAPRTTRVDRAEIALLRREAAAAPMIDPPPRPQPGGPPYL